MGHSAQISSLYFMNKLSISVFGLVEHSTNAGKCFFYLSDKMQGGAKSSNHILNYLMQ
jgi:hypothetical protein